MQVIADCRIVCGCSGKGLLGGRRAGFLKGVGRDQFGHLEHAHLLADICRQHKATVMVAFSFRFLPAIVRLREPSAAISQKPETTVPMMLPARSRPTPSRTPCRRWRRPKWLRPWSRKRIF
jgi:hypothetical protein